MMRLILYVMNLYLISFGLMAVSFAESLPIIFNSTDLPFNRNYEIRIYNSKSSCKTPNTRPKVYQIYSTPFVNNLRADEFCSSLWAKVVEGDIDRSYCTKGEFLTNKVLFTLKPNYYHEKRIAIVVANSGKLSKNMGGWNIWDALMNTMILSYQNRYPVTLVSLNEDSSIDFVVQAEDIAHMYRSYEQSNPYPQLTKKIRSKLTMDQSITEPMKSLYSVHGFFKDKLQSVIYITDQHNVPELTDMKTNPSHALMPLHWSNNDTPLEVITNGKCYTWEKVNAECHYSSSITLDLLSKVIKVPNVYSKQLSSNHRR